MGKSRKDREQLDDDFNFFEIDEHNLDKEWIKQPSLYFTWARKLADARLAVDEAKSELDVIKAEASRAIRDDPGEFGFEKVSEAIVATAVNEHPDVMKGVQKLYDARHEHDVYQAAVFALEHRKRALEKLVDLHGQSYFSTPKTHNAKAAERLEDAGKRHVRQKGQSKKNEDSDEDE